MGAEQEPRASQYAEKTDALLRIKTEMCLLKPYKSTFVTRDELMSD